MHEDDSFAQKYEVLFVGKVTVAHKKAPPALIDECIDKFNHLREHDEDDAQGALAEKGPERPPAEISLSLRSKLLVPLSQKRNKSAPWLTVQHEPLAVPSQGTLEKCKSLDGSNTLNCDGAESGGLVDAMKRAASVPNFVQPTNMKANRTMLFTVMSG